MMLRSPFPSFRTPAPMPARTACGVPWLRAWCASSPAGYPPPPVEALPRRARHEAWRYPVGGMIYRRQTPRAPLSDFVELLWLFENAASSHASERVLPTGTAELVINLGETGSFDAVVAGPHSRFFVLDTSRPSSIIGVHFKPGGAFPFLALPVDELRNRHVPLEALWAGRTAELRERLLAAEGAEARLVLLERMLLSLLQRPQSRHAAVGHALAAFRRGRPHRRRGR